MYKPLTIQYVDPLVIMTLANAFPNDQELGEVIRRYLKTCNDAIGQDALFFKNSKLRMLANDPTQYAQKITDIQNG